MVDYYVGLTDFGWGGFSTGSATSKSVQGACVCSQLGNKQTVALAICVCTISLERQGAPLQAGSNKTLPLNQRATLLRPPPCFSIRHSFLHLIMRATNTQGPKWKYAVIIRVDCEVLKVM